MINKVIASNSRCIFIKDSEFTEISYSSMSKTGAPNLVVHSIIGLMIFNFIMWLLAMFPKPLFSAICIILTIDKGYCI